MTASEADAELLPVDYFAEPEPPEESDSHERSHLSLQVEEVSGPAPGARCEKIRSIEKNERVECFTLYLKRRTRVPVHVLRAVLRDPAPARQDGSRHVVNALEHNGASHYCG